MDISPEDSEVVSGPDVRGLRDALEEPQPPLVTGLQVDDCRGMRPLSLMF